jgi:division protein CdvB (Snf7/Vps24/ESCRT-III family)
MDNIKELSKKKYVRTQKRNTIISQKLNNEIKATQKLLSDIYRKRYKRKKSFSRIQASDFIADTYRTQRYKIKNG